MEPTTLSLILGGLRVALPQLVAALNSLDALENGEEPTDEDLRVLQEAGHDAHNRLKAAIEHYGETPD